MAEAAIITRGLSKVDLNEEIEPSNGIPATTDANKDYIFEFTLGKEVVSLVNIQFFPAEDREELIKILKWLQNNHKDNKLTISELRSFNKLISNRFSRLAINLAKFEKQRFFRVLFREREPEWASVNESTLKKVPFLEAVSSARWNQSSDGYSPATITSVRASSLDHLDIILKIKGEKEKFLEFMFLASSMNDPFVPKEMYEDLDFMGIFTGEAPDIKCIEKSDIAETCVDIRNRDKDAATKLLLAIYVERFDGKSLDLKTRDQIYEAFLFIVSHPGTYNDEFVCSTKAMYEKFKFSQKQLDRLHELEGGVAGKSHGHNNRYGGWDNIYYSDHDHYYNYSYSDPEDDSDYNCYY